MSRNSPSSIIVYNQCPRLYYYQYIERKPSFPHIDLIKGSVVHETIREFFTEAPSPTDMNPKVWTENRLMKAFVITWDAKRDQIQRLNLSDNEIKLHNKECYEMLLNWGQYFITKLQKTSFPLYEAFIKIKPKTEAEVTYEEYEIKGLIDSIEHINGETWIIDYKTSSKFEITRENRLQLALYALMYKKNYKIQPDKAGVFFLKERLHLIAVDDQMLEYADKECKNIFEKTQTRNIEDYPQNVGYLCRALSGACPCHRYE